EVARAAVDEHRLGQHRGQDDPEQRVAEDGADAGREDGLPRAHGDGRDDRAGAEDAEEAPPPRGESRGRLRIDERPRRRRRRGLGLKDRRGGDGPRRRGFPRGQNLNFIESWTCRSVVPHSAQDGLASIVEMVPKAAFPSWPWGWPNCGWLSTLNASTRN